MFIPSFLLKFIRVHRAATTSDTAAESTVTTGATTVVATAAAAAAAHPGRSFGRLADFNQAHHLWAQNPPEAPPSK